MDIMAILKLAEFGIALAGRGIELVNKLKVAGRDQARADELADLDRAHNELIAAYSRLFPGSTPPKQNGP